MPLSYAHTVPRGCSIRLIIQSAEYHKPNLNVDEFPFKFNSPFPILYRSQLWPAVFLIRSYASSLTSVWLLPRYGRGKWGVPFKCMHIHAHLVAVTQYNSLPLIKKFMRQHLNRIIIIGIPLLCIVRHQTSRSQAWFSLFARTCRHTYS